MSQHMDVAKTGRIVKMPGSVVHDVVAAGSANDVVKGVVGVVGVVAVVDGANDVVDVAVGATQLGLDHPLFEKEGKK